MKFDSPFLIVYIGTSLFSVFLPMRLGYERYSLRRYRGDGGSGSEDNVVIIPWRNNVSMTSTASSSSSYAREGVEVGEEDAIEGLVLSSQSSQHSSNNHHLNGNNNHDDYSFNDERSVQHYEPNHPPPSRNNSSISNTSSNTSNAYLLSHTDHISMASQVAPLWFTSNYFYAMSLKWTTISSSTVLASMGSIFAFLFATRSKYGDEKVTKGKLMGVVLCFLGGVATTWTDVGSTNTVPTTPDIDDGSGGGEETLRHLRYLRHPASWSHKIIPRISDLDDDSSLLILLGDLAGFFSAMGYGAYTVLIRHLCPKDENRMSMQLLFGYIGLWNMVLLFPVAIWVALKDNQNIPTDSSSSNNSEWEESQSDNNYPHNDNNDDNNNDNIHTTLTWSIFLFLLLKGLLDNVLSDYLWARAVILTSATVASVGVGLTIPMAFVADWVMGNYDTGSTHAGQVYGAVLVLLGFVFVNVNVFGERDYNGGGGGREELEGNFEEDGTIMGSQSAHDVEILS